MCACARMCGILRRGHKTRGYNFIVDKQKAVQFGLFVVNGTIHWHRLCLCKEGRDSLTIAINVKDTDVLFPSNF